MTVAERFARLESARQARDPRDLTAPASAQSPTNFHMGTGIVHPKKQREVTPDGLRYAQTEPTRGDTYLPSNKGGRAARDAKKWADRVAAHQCGRCGVPLPDGYTKTSCAPCLRTVADRERQRWQQGRAAAVCPRSQCGQPTDGYTYCPKHRAHYRDVEAQRRRRGRR